MSTNRAQSRYVSRWILRLLCLAVVCPFAKADAQYYKHTLFDNSLEPDAYYYSSGRASLPSTLELVHGKLPVSRDVFYTPPNALRLKWRSVPDGGWEAGISAINFRNREINFQGDTLYFWCFSEEGISASALPLVQLSDTDDNFSISLPLGKFVPDLAPGKWVQVQIPLEEFKTGSIHELQPHRVNKVVFIQNKSDSAEHTLIVDEFMIDDRAVVSSGLPGMASILPAPQNVHAKGYERHIDITWDAMNSPLLERYVVYRSLDGDDFQPIGIQVPGVNRYTDYLGKTGVNARYKVAASDRQYNLSSFSNVASAGTRRLNDDELITMLQEACFRYYWEGAHPVAGMTLESIPGDDRIVATGASGFGIMALIVGVDREFISREQGLDRLTMIVTFLEKAPRYHGVWSHFMDGNSGQTLPVFDRFDNGGDLVETAFLMEGLLSARQYFNRTTEHEKVLFRRISQLWETVEWDWYRQSPQSAERCSLLALVAGVVVVHQPSSHRI